MKIGFARGPGKFGGIFRRFRALAQYCGGHGHDAVGFQTFGELDGVIDGPMRTVAFSSRYLPPDLWRATTSAQVLDALQPMVDRVAAALETERCDTVLAADIDLKGLVMVAACRKAGVPVTTFVAGVARIEAASDGHAGTPYVEDVERYCLAQSDQLIFPSRLARAECAAGSATLARSRVIYNGIADEFFETGSGAADAGMVGAIMRLSAVKNPGALGKVARALAPRGIRVELVTDAARARPALLRAIDGVRIVPPTTDTRSLAQFYSRCRAVVCPSRFEASGNVPMEALAAGVPAVITDRMGTAELYEELGLSDLVVGVDDIDTTVARLESAAPIGDAVRRHLHQAFRWPVVAERIVPAL